MARLVKRFTGGSKVAEELSYMADVLNAIIKMSVEGGEFAIKPGVGATLSLTKDDIIRIVKMTSDLPAAEDGLLEREEGTAKLLQPGRNTGGHHDILEVIEGGEIDVHNRFGFSVGQDEITMVIKDLRTGEWWPVGGGGDPFQVMIFQIVNGFPEDNSAQVIIEERSFSGTAYGSYLDDTVVDVYDAKECSINEPNVELTGRFGEAKLMRTTERVAFGFYGTSLAYAPPFYWDVTLLCCPPTECVTV